MRRGLIWVGCVLAVVAATGGLLVLATSGAASFRQEGDRLIVSGQLTLMSTERIDTITEENPGLRVLVLEDIAEGSDPTALMQKGALVRSLGMTTMVAPGVTLQGAEVFLFLGGVERLLGEGAAIEVSDWSSAAGPASMLPPDHPAHSERRVHVTEMLGRADFYEFMIEAAPVDGAHRMTPGALAAFGVVTGL